MELPFGVIDHLDQQKAPIHETYDSRLDLIQRFDRAGFYGFHLTEHHFTPLGLAPSPNVFLAAAARLTENIKLIPLVLILPLYHPLRLASEIVMLDHLTKGRYEFATGRGISPYELAFYGVNHLEAPHIYKEALNIIMQALTKDVISFQGKYFNVFDVPVTMKPYTQPHPGMWYATSNVESAAGAARDKRNLAMLAPAQRAAPIIKRYKETWAEVGEGKPLPKLGIARHIYVAETDAKALKRGMEGYKVWYEKFGLLWSKYDPRPFTFSEEAILKTGTLIAGSPQTVREEIERQVELCGANYFITRFAYGDISHEASVASLDLFIEEVMPKFGAKAAAKVQMA